MIMRKYRAWDTEKEVMATVLYMGFEDFEVHLKDDECRRWTTVYPYVAKVMEYTGFTDKNGEYIYEGDIIRFNDEKFKITSEIGGFMITKINEKTCMYKNFKDCWNDNVYPLSQFYWNNGDDFNFDNVEVIGNIYKNKELLKV